LPDANKTILQHYINQNPAVMKKIFFFILSFALICRVLACSCAPYEPDFYKNVSGNTSNCFAVFDTLDYNFTFEGLESQTAYLILLDTINSIGSEIGDTIVITGQDGFNCGEILTGFNRGDTMVFALHKGFYYQFERDTFYLDGVCGKHYLKIENGHHNELTMSEIKDKIVGIMLSSDGLQNTELITVFPNPTNGEVKIDAHKERVLGLKIIDISGRIIYRKDENFDYLEIDLTGFDSGIYNLCFQTGKYQVNRKIVKQ